MCVYFNRIFENRIIALIVILCELLILAGVLYCMLFCVCACACVYVHVYIYIYIYIYTCVCAFVIVEIYTQRRAQRRCYISMMALLSCVYVCFVLFITLCLICDDTISELIVF